jgi:hypothetical protein
MPVEMADEIFDLLPAPTLASYAPVRKAPKVKFQAEAGYTHQRERYPSARRTIPYEWTMLTLDQKNLLEAWLDDTGSKAFYFVTYESLIPLADGSVVPELRLGRIIDEETVIKPNPRAFGRWAGKFTIEEV